MSPRRAHTLALILAALALGLQIAGYTGYLATGFELAAQTPVASAIAIAFSAVGALVAVRHPRNAIG